jgi:hypothetical protein
MNQLILDAHTHAGLTVPFENLRREWSMAGIDGGVFFSPVEEVYDRFSPGFVDSEDYRASRAAVHAHLLELGKIPHMFPYFFVWNDFPVAPEGFVGVKWHRHSGEPRYQYGSAACESFLEDVCRRGLPIVLEEEFGNTLTLIERIGGRTVVIIPHLGGLNGGYDKLKRAGVFSRPRVWGDTALAGEREIRDFASVFGPDRLLFGSDYPFGIPAQEKAKVCGIFEGLVLQAVLGDNLLRLLGRARADWAA